MTGRDPRELRRLQVALELALVNLRNWRRVALPDLSPFQRLVLRQECEALLEAMAELETRERGRTH